MTLSLNTLHAPDERSSFTPHATATITPSPYQQAIYDFVRQSSGNAVVEAVAGSGKTTTIVNAIAQLPAGASSIFLAFNKSIAEELRARGVNGSTFHALALNGLRGTLPPKFKIEGSKVAKIFRTIVAEPLQESLADVPRLVSLGKNYGIGAFDNLPNTPTTWRNIIAHHDLTFDDETKACEFASRILRISNDDRNTIDFDDMLYLNILLAARMPKFDYLFVDEAQDTNGIQLAVLEKCLTPESRIIFVGDSHQAIYGFRGAGTDSISRIITAFDASTLPLSVSYRCSRAVVNLAKRYVPQIEPSDSAPDGSVSHHNAWTADVIPDGAAIICRNTRPIIRTAYDLLRAGRRVQVLGRDIGTAFKAILKKCKAPTLEELIVSVEKRRDAEVMRETARENDAKAAAIDDRYNSLLMILNQLDPATSVREVPAAIDELFADHPGAIQLATVHKAKGLEWDNVFILDFDTLMPSRWAREGWQLDQEHNIIYVAITRAKEHLHFINSKEYEA